MGVVGVLSDFLNALKSKGKVSSSVEIHVAASGVTNDVSRSNTVIATFDANGDWTVNNPIV